MNDKLLGLLLDEYIIAYIDDICISFQNKGNHQKNLKAVAKRLNEYGIQINIKNPFKECINLCGHIMSHQQLKMDEKK